METSTNITVTAWSGSKSHARFKHLFSRRFSECKCPRQRSTIRVIDRKRQLPEWRKQHLAAQSRIPGVKNEQLREILALGNRKVPHPTGRTNNGEQKYRHGCSRPFSSKSRSPF